MSDSLEDPMRRVPNLRHWAVFFYREEEEEERLYWAKYGKCHGRNDLAHMFHPPLDDTDESTTEARLLTIMAKKFCKGSVDGKKCPVIKECLNYAIENRNYEGVWGATSGRERRRLVAQRNAEARSQPRRTGGSKRT